MIKTTGGDRTQQKRIIVPYFQYQGGGSKYQVLSIPSGIVRFCQNFLFFHFIRQSQHSSKMMFIHDDIHLIVPRILLQQDLSKILYASNFRFLC